MATFTGVERDPREILAATVRDSGLVEAGSRGVALLSGGPDSACLAAGLAAALKPGSVLGLHLNYRLREGADADEETCRRLCGPLGIELRVERPELGPGNTQAAARDARYAAAERLRAESGAAWIATGHTRTDLAETMLYRLAASPGRRALLGLAPRRGAVVRPLLALGRDRTRELAAAAGLPFADDPSNEDPRFARARLRHEVLPVLRELSPAAEENLAATWAELSGEGELLDALAEQLLAQAASEGAALQASLLSKAHPALQRLALRAFAERFAPGPVSLSPAQSSEIVRLASHPEGGQVDLGGGLRALCEAGTVRITAAASESVAEPAGLTVPGSCRFGGWELRAELREAPVDPQGPDVATLDAAALGRELSVRAWRDGDRMRPLGLDGTKTLQDLFTDRRVPRSLRHELPVVLSGERIAWVAGVAVAEEFRLTERTRRAAVLTASPLG